MAHSMAHAAHTLAHTRRARMLARSGPHTDITNMPIQRQHRHVTKHHTLESNPEGGIRGTYMLIHSLMHSCTASLIHSQYTACLYKQVCAQRRATKQTAAAHNIVLVYHSLEVPQTPQLLAESCIATTRSAKCDQNHCSSRAQRSGRTDRITILNRPIWPSLQGVSRSETSECPSH